MTGPRILTVHPHRRRARRLLPFLLAIVVSPLACTSDQPTEASSQPQGQMAVATGSHPRARLSSSRVSASSIQAAKPRASASFAVASTTSSTAQSVLILADADGPSTNALADTLTSAGFQVTVRPAPEYGWNGTNPVLDGFDVVVHLNGSTYDGNFDVAAQQTLSSFVQNGGGYIGAQWNGAEFTPGMADLILQGVGSSNGTEQNCAVCQVTYEAVGGQEGHPVLSGLPTSFTFTADGHDAGEQLVTQGTTVLMRLPNVGPDLGGPAVLVREFGAGKVVNFSIAPNYPFDDSGMPQTPATLHSGYIKGLYVNAVRWTAGSSAGQPEPQTITFDPIQDKVYGEPAFSVSATASSALPVSLSATGECTVAGSTVTITAAGTCTITAQQAGNANYQPAEDVVRSFAIAKAPATITIGTEFTFDGTVKSAMSTTNPAGLSTVTLTYSQNGSPVAQPINAGTYQVLGTLDNPNYEAPQATGTLTILQATPAIRWTPASISASTPLGAAQLNATATGVGGSSLAGSFVYDPAAGTLLSAGTRTLSVQFTPSNPNYTGATRTITITVASGLNFTGFFAPVRNGPVLNRVTAGSAIPMKFAIGGYQGLQILQGTPTSIPVACSAGSSESSLPPSLTLGTSGLRAVGYTYTYVWKTNPGWGSSCRKFILTLVDGSTHEALFRFVQKPTRGVPGRRAPRGR